MPKILLINPSFNIVKANYDSSVSVGLLSIATYLNKRDVEVEIIDGARQKNYLDLIGEKVKNCDYAGLSVMTTQSPGALKISRLIRDANPGCRIIWGGTHPTFFPEQTASHPLIDAVVYGEGEETVYELATGKDWSGIKGIVYKDGGQIISNSPRELGDPSRMPLFNWDLMPQEVLRKLYLIPSLTSRGCPHRCTFCINAILKNKWRARTTEQVLEDLRIIKSADYFRDKKIRFWDENFFVDIGRAKAIIEEMIRNDLNISWETTARAGYVKEGMIDDDFLAKLKQSGCYLLSFGAESGSPAILKKIQKDITAEEILYSAKQCLKYDIIPQYSFMIGLPEETREDMFMTLDLIDKLVKLSDKVQILGPQAFRPYPGSPLYEECKEAGWREPQSLEEWASLIEDELNYLSVENFPWVKDNDFVESMEAYVRFGAHSVKSAMGSSVKARSFLKLGFILLCQLRWRTKFFRWPVEYKLAKRFVSQQ
ncbi:MAG: cobalamin B12-binding domain-containing protein [Candidatus Portnoybacteria bacterium]|nr:cobalamin B12-binding domain-containing protein [Candidatus Portnoybacteria bacterium]